MSFENHAIVELFGHQRIVGKVTDFQIGGASFIRVDVPETPGIPAFTKFFGASAIYAITPVDEETANLAARAYVQSPINKFHIAQLLPSSDTGPNYRPPQYEDDDDDDWDYPPDDDDDDFDYSPDPDDDGDLEFDHDAVISVAPFAETSGETVAHPSDSANYDEDADSVPF